MFPNFNDYFTIIFCLWLGGGSWLGTYINFKYPAETPLYMFRTMLMLTSIMSLGGLIYGILGL